MRNTPIDSSENIFLNLLNIVADPMSIVDENGRVLLVNKAFENATGSGKNELVGIVFSESNNLTPESKRLLLENFRKRMEGLSVQPYEITFTNKSGETKFVEVKATRISYNGEPADLVIFRDITQREIDLAKIKEYAEKMETLVDEKVKEIKDSAEKLREAEERYHALFSQAPLGILLVDPETSKAVEFNDEAHLQLGYPREEFAKLTIHNYEVAKTPEKTKARMKRILETGIAEFETQHCSKSGEIRDVINAVQVVELGGKKYFHIITQDITEKKILQNKLKEYSEKLEQLVAERTAELKQTQAKLLKAEKLAAIGELAGMVGHDLRNPLTGIRGAVYYLQNRCGAEIDAKGKEMLRTIDRAIVHSNKIVSDLVCYSGNLALEFQETTPKALLKKALIAIEIPARIKVVDATKTEPSIRADVESMQKVFVNIITNAIYAVPETGTLTIASKAAGSSVEIVFKDTGTGMTEETLQKLKLGFPLFTTKAKGMGFGLPIAKRIIDAHGGKISIASTLGKGTTVTITIPRNPEPPREDKETWIFAAPPSQIKCSQLETS